MSDIKSMEDKLDKILRVTTRTEVQVEELMKADCHTRLVKLESAHKFWRSLVLFVPGLGGLVLGCLRFFNKV